MVFFPILSSLYTEKQRLRCAACCEVWLVFFFNPSNRLLMDLLRKHLWLWVVFGMVFMSVTITIVFLFICKCISRRGRFESLQHTFHKLPDEPSFVSQENNLASFSCLHTHLFSSSSYIRDVEMEMWHSLDKRHDKTSVGVQMYSFLLA